ncbi:MAG TPA: RNA polymerase sigma factor [Microthrixaceae bacterium]|nr:RNA polymerase sigma factor [Microthrixaceae bacterium]
MQGRSESSPPPDVTSPGDEESEPSVRDQYAKLVTLAQGGDEAAFRQLVDATYRTMYTLAYRLTGDEEDARDVTQEAYLRAYKGLSGFRGDAQFTTWMYRVTANCAATYVQRRSRHRHDRIADEVDLRDPRPDADPESRSEASDLRERLRVSVDALPPKLRAVVVLRDVYEMPHEDIAEELGISVTAAKVRLHRARHRLRSEMFPGLDEVDSRAV